MSRIAKRGGREAAALSRRVRRCADAPGTGEAEMEIAGQAALISGGGSGLGRATAQALAQAGARVAVLDINKAAAVAAAKEIGGFAAAGGMKNGAGTQAGG